MGRFIALLHSHVLLTACVVCAACTACTTDRETLDSTRYTVSIAPIKYLMEGLIGNSVQIEVLVPRGVSPETFDPAPSLLSQLRHSSAFIEIGNLGFEQVWTKRIQELYPQLPVYSLTPHGTHAGYTAPKQQADLTPQATPSEMCHPNTHSAHTHHHDTHAHDPHVWMSPRYMRLMADSLAAFLLTQDHEVNTDFPARITQIDDSITRILAYCQGATFLVYHPVLTDFARDYGLHQLAIEVDGKEPTMKHLRTLSEQCRAVRPKVIFVQAEFDNRMARMLAEELGIAMEAIDPLTENWEQELIRIARLLQTYYE